MTQTNQSPGIAAMPQAEQAMDICIITIEGRDTQIPMATLGVDMNSTEAEFLRAAEGTINEMRQGQGQPPISLSDPDGAVAYTVRKLVDSRSAIIMPKPVAG